MRRTPRRQIDQGRTEHLLAMGIHYIAAADRFEPYPKDGRKTIAFDWERGPSKVGSVFIVSLSPLIRQPLKVC